MYPDNSYSFILTGKKIYKTKQGQSTPFVCLAKHSQKEAEEEAKEGTSAEPKQGGTSEEPKQGTSEQAKEDAGGEDAPPPAKKRKPGRPVGGKNKDYEKILPKREGEKRVTRQRVPFKV